VRCAKQEVRSSCVSESHKVLAQLPVSSRRLLYWKLNCGVDRPLVGSETKRLKRGLVIARRVHVVVAVALVQGARTSNRTKVRRHHVTESAPHPPRHLEDGMRRLDP
jgi:hypothetical protein